MIVPIVKSWDEARPYLEMLAQTVNDDICPLLDTKGGAPHTISREVCCYIDYLGALYVGTHKYPCGFDGLAQVGPRFKAYLREVMEKTDQGYERYAELIYQMYRNGPVHNFDPQVLKNKQGQTLAWFEYPGPRQDTYKEWNMPVRHLQPVQYPGSQNVYYLPASTICLIEDLLSSIDHFKDGLGRPDERITPWNEAAEILNKPKECDFNLP